MSAPKILVVDDSRTVRVQLRQMLSDTGCEVILAVDGEDGIRQAVHERPQLLILDIQMPGKDGYAVCQELKRMGAPWDQLPVIFLTVLESHALELLGSKMGAYLHKPVQRESLLRAVDKFLQTSARDDSSSVRAELSPQSLAPR